MALSISITLSLPLSAEKFSSEELRPRKAPLAILLSLANVKTASNLLLNCYSTREILWTRNRQGHLAPPDHFGELVFSCTSANCSTHRIICGYWVGPDIDDGWGFVEAFVNPTT